jgi:hypothetical protein
MLNRPSYVPLNIAVAPLSFAWSNEVALKLDDFDALPARLVDAVEVINYKGKLALGLACLEWVFWRLEGHTDVADALNRIEAAWATQISIRYARSLNYSGVSNTVMTQGNPDGPRQSALLRLTYMDIIYRKGKTQMISEAVRCATLAHHVLPADCGFEPWLQSSLKALASAYPCGSDYDRRARSFDYSAEPPVPRAWLESLTIPADPAAERAALDAFLRDLKPAANPYLIPANEMCAAGFTGEPYRMA